MCKVKHGDDYTAKAETEAGMGAGQNNGVGVWKWAAGIMSSLVLLLVGAFIGDFAASIRYASLTTKFDNHAKLVGHPVMVQRVQSIQEDLREIKDQQRDNSVVLDDIYRSLPK